MPLRTLVRVIGRATVDLLGFAYGLFAPVRLTASEREFVDANRALWQEVVPEADHDGELLVEPMFHPVILHANASFAVIVGRTRRLRPLFALRSHADRRAKALLSSYPGARFTYLHSPRTVPAWIAAWVKAVRVYRGLRAPKDILELAAHGYRYGDVIYDALLARGYATVSAVDFWTLAILQRYFFDEWSIERIAREHHVRGYVSSHSYIGLLQGTWARWLMRRHVEVLARIGTRDLFVRTYRTPEEVGYYPLRPEPPMLATLMSDPSGEARRHADRYIEERFAQAWTTLRPRWRSTGGVGSTPIAPRSRPGTGSTPTKPIIFVMLHAFNDYPHSHYQRPFMFQDYYDWFVRTLERARSVTSVNWVFKEHPGADYYPTKDVDVRRVMEAVPRPHTVFLPREADFNAASIRHVGDAIVTCIGSAGMEYACVGIPCLVAGEGPYTGYGFTREPPDRASYLRELEAIGSLPRLTDEQVRIARLVAWYMLGVVYDLRYVLGPAYEYWQIVDPKRVDVWGDEATVIRTVDRDALRRQMDAIAEFLASDNALQLIDLEKYPFLRPGIGLPDRAA